MKILVVEDDPSLVTVVEKILVRDGHEVSLASDGMAARNVIAIENFDLIISDIRMPNLNGIELLHYVKKTKFIPVILMTGFSEICETKEASDLGAFHFLAKPFTRDDLRAAITLVNPKSTVKAEDPCQDSLYSNLRIEEFVTGKEINFDIFIRLSNVKYVKIAAKSESIDVDRILNYRTRGVTHLHMRKEDFRRYLGFTSNLATLVSNSDKIEQERKVQFLVQTSMSIMKDLHVENVDPILFSMATEICATTVDVLNSRTDLNKIFEMFKAHSDTEYSHSLAVSIYSVLIAKAVGWKSPRTLVHLSMCGMMHDIGKKEIPAELLKKPRAEMSHAEITLLETHTSRGAEILSRIKGLPEDVALVALQHHENCQGTGFPSRLGKAHIMPFAKLVGLANEFCRLALPGPDFEGIEAREAVGRIYSLGAGRFDAVFLEGLSSVVNGTAKFGN